MIKPGIDVLLERGLGDLRGVALGLLTGSGGVTADLVPTITALRAHPDAHLVALFGAEHGVRGEAAAGERVPSGRDAATGLPVHSLYGETREPTDAMLAGLEAIVVDLQDVGLRYYTYPSTVLALLRAAAPRGIAVVVLDRPDPLTGTILEGPLAEPAFRSFMGAAPAPRRRRRLACRGAARSGVPVRHGLTLGELAGWMIARDDIGADLRVVAMDGWRRGMWFDDTGLPWVPPSPNIPSLAACVAYTATCLIEGTTVSEGRGTPQPFEVIGAPWVDAHTLAARLNDLNLAGVRFRPTWFRPTTSKHAGHTCGGVQLHVVDRIAFAGVRTGLHVLATLRSLYPEQVTWGRGESGSYVVDLLLGTDAPRRAIERGDDVEVVAALWQSALEVFRAERRPFLLYDE